MQAKKGTNYARPSLLDVVALLTDLPAQRLARGQVGTIVEQLDDKTLLVEFSDDQGRAYAVGPCRRENLLVLHYGLTIERRRREDRIALVEDVLDSLDRADPSIDHLWAREASDRLAAYRRGELAAKDLGAIVARYRR